MAEVRKASSRGIARLRPLLALLTAALMAGAIACHTDAGVVAVVPSDEELIAITHDYGEGGDRHSFNHRSQDGGLTWDNHDAYALVREIDWRKYVSQHSIDTPRGAYRIDGADIQRHTPDGEYQTVYSAAHLLSTNNLWLQAENIDGTGNYLVLSSGPVSITYDPISGNVVAAMGILGVAAGTPDESWTTAGVGPYYPLDFSGSARVGALWSSISLWAAVLTFPFATIAVIFTVVSLARMFPVYAWAGGYFNTASQSFISVPLAILSILIAFYLLASVGTVGVDDFGDPLGDSSQKITTWFGLVVSAVFSLISVAGSLDSLEYSTNGAWRFSRRMLAITVGAVAAMMAFTLLSLLAGTQWGNDLKFAVLASILLCVAIAVGLIRYYWPASRKVTTHQS